MLHKPVKPMLLTMQRDSFDDDRYIFEPKWDGWRILLHKGGDRVEAYTRHGRRVTEKFPELRELAGAIRTHSALLDAEGICMRDGRPVFDDFAYRGRLTEPVKVECTARTHLVTFFTWDVLHTSRVDQIHVRLTDRKARLQVVFSPSPVLPPRCTTRARQGVAPVDHRLRSGRHRGEAEGLHISDRHALC